MSVPAEISINPPDPSIPAHQTGIPMKIALLGQFGSGNSGNDGSLEAMLLYLRRWQPEAELVCICSNPALVAERYNIRTMSVGGPILSSPSARAINRMLLKLPRRFVSLLIAIAQMSSLDMMIIPGTGILDDFQEGAFGWPFVVFCWCLVARFCRTKIAFVNIGAGPIEGKLSRWFLKSAAKMAFYRSYRDDYSLEFMRELGMNVASDRRYPDIAFTLPAPEMAGRRPAHGRLRIAVGIMYYRGWRAKTPRQKLIYDTYIEKICTFIAWLLEKDCNVSLLLGDAADQQACDDIMSRLATTVGRQRLTRIDASLGKSLHEIMEQLADVDLAVVSRYHNLVCSLKLGRPTVSIGYARKNDELMRAFNQEKYCLQIEEFDVEQLKALFDEMLIDRQRIEDRVEKTNATWRKQFMRQHLRAQLLLPHTSQRPTPARRRA